MRDGKMSVDLYKGLEAVAASAFPKRCLNCGAEYVSVEEYVKRTEPIGGQSGLTKSFDDNDNPIVQLFRNCVCGSTLMDCFSDRRDTSAAGRKRREMFDKLLKNLIHSGMPEDEARQLIGLCIR